MGTGCQTRCPCARCASDGLYALRHDRRGRAPGLGTACEQEARGRQANGRTLGCVSALRPSKLNAAVLADRGLLNGLHLSLQSSQLSTQNVCPPDPGYAPSPVKGRSYFRDSGSAIKRPSCARTPGGFVFNTHDSSHAGGQVPPIPMKGGPLG